MKKIVRLRDEKMIAGICGGIGHLIGIDPTMIRLALVFLCVITGVVPLLACYLVGWIIIPEQCIADITKNNSSSSTKEGS
jgi:phage shock protein C